MKFIDEDELIERVHNSGEFTNCQKLAIIGLIKKSDAYFEVSGISIGEPDEDETDDITLIDDQIKHVVSESKYASENVENCGSALAGLSDSLCRLIELKRSIISKEIGE